jgi:inner membrane protein
MRGGLSLKRLGEALGRDLPAVAILACAALLFLADWGYQRAGDSFFPGGPLDETAHLLTALLLLQVLPGRLRAGITAPALIGSVAIDLDHVPQYLGDNFFTVGTPRPYTHSLLTLLVLLLFALAARSRRNLFLGLALGVTLHFFRDLAEGTGSGVALLWPVSDHAFSYQHSTYLALMVCVVAADLCLAGLKPRLQTASP